MAMHSKGGQRPKRFVPPTVLTAIFGATLAVGACSQIPDAINPVEWYKATADFLTGGTDYLYDNEKTAQAEGEKQRGLVADRGAPPPGAEKPIPNLATVPAKPQVSDRGERQQVAQGLVSDRRQGRYSSELIQRQGEPVQTLRPGSTVARATDRPPPPPAIPTQPVTHALTMPRATTAPATQVAAAPRRGASVEEVYRLRLAQGLSTKTGDEATPANAQFATGPQTFDTIVVSSQGVEPLTGSAAEAVSALPAMPRLAGTVPATRTPVARGNKVATILFSHGSSSLDARDKRILRDVVAIHRQHGGRLQVIGHASARTRSMDPARHKMVNFEVSSKRANSVARELLRGGIDRQSVLVTARGDAHPIFYEVMPTGEAGNRRAEVYIVN